MSALIGSFTAGKQKSRFFCCCGCCCCCCCCCCELRTLFQLLDWIFFFFGGIFCSIVGAGRCSFVTGFRLSAAIFFCLCLNTERRKQPPSKATNTHTHTHRSTSIRRFQRAIELMLTSITKENPIFWFEIYNSLIDGHRIKPCINYLKWNMQLKALKPGHELCKSMDGWMRRGRSLRWYFPFVFCPMVIESMKSLPLDGGGEGEEEEEEEEGGFLLFLSLWADSKEILQRCLCPRIAV